MFDGRMLAPPLIRPGRPPPPICVSRPAPAGSPTTYIRNRKLDLAHALLRQQGNDITLAEVAARLHFSSQSQFTRYFRERFGLLLSELQA